MTTKQGTKADLQKTLTALEQLKKQDEEEHKKQIGEAIEIFGSFLDLVYLMKSFLPKGNMEIIDGEIQEMQKRFYRIASLNGLSILTPAQKKIVEGQHPYKRIIFTPDEEQPQSTEPTKIQIYNQKIDERNRIISQNVDKPYLPLYDGE